MKIVYFYLETTGINNKSKPENVEIIEIGAHYENKMFHRYIVPNGQITRKSTDVHGLSKRGNVLHHRNKGEIFYAEKNPRKGLQKFVNWLQELKEETKTSIVLCSYNSRKFDSIVLTKNLEAHNISFNFSKDGFDLFAFGDASDIVKDLKEKGTKKRNANRQFKKKTTVFSTNDFFIDFFFSNLLA